MIYNPLKAKGKRLSLMNSILIRVFLLSMFIVSISTFLSYYSVYEKQTKSALTELQTYVTDRVRSDSEIFILAEDNLQAFEKEFLTLYLSDKDVSQEEFWDYYFVDHDGATRMKREYFDGIFNKENEYIYGMSSFIGNNQQTDDPDLQRRLVLSYKVLSRLGPAWINRFANVHVAFPENAIILFYPEEPWGLQAKADLPMNELGVIKAVNKKDNPERKSIWSGLYYDETVQKWVVTYMDPVDHNGVHLITPGHDVYLTDLMDRLVEQKEDGTYNFIIRKDGYLVAHPTQPNDEQKWIGQLSLEKINIPTVKEAYKLITEQITDTSEVHIIENKHDDTYLAVGEIQGPEWLFVRVLPMENIRQVAHEAARGVFVGGMGILFAILLIVYFVMRYQAETPIKQLSYAAEIIGEGRYAEVAEMRIPLPVGLRNEIGLLSVSFVEMATKIKGSKEDLERIVEERTKALEKANTNLMEMSLLDGLTGIHNRRSFDQNIAKVFYEAREDLGTFAVMIADIDYFKNYNDTYGHAEGDRVLKQIAETIKNIIREDDRVFRYGGEEFVVIFNHADLSVSQSIANRILTAITDLAIDHRESPYGILTLSGGIVEYSSSFSDPEEIIRVADQKLYMAKNDGRNNIKT